MYNTVMAAIKYCQTVNAADNYEGDFLFVMCKGGTHYTNELGDIMPTDFEGDFYNCGTIEETAAKFSEICLNDNKTPEDIYTGY